MNIYRDEKELIIEHLWAIVLREVGKVDDAGMDWFTVGDETYIGVLDWQVSQHAEVARCVNAINSLDGHPEFAYRSYDDAEGDGGCGADE